MRLKLLTFLLILAFSSWSQELPRKAVLGIGVVNLNDSIIKANKLQQKEGVLINRVLPNTTASNLKLLPGDVITQINQTKITHRVQVFSISREARAGDNFEIHYTRADKKLISKAKALAKPKESSPFGEVIYGSVPTEFGLLRTIIHKPTGVGNAPAIFFLQGIYCSSQDFWLASTEPTKLLIDDFVKAGYMVYRVERPGLGDSEGIKHCRDLDFNEELDITKLAYEDLLGRRDVDSSNVYLFGHSMGSVTAPLLAKEFQPKGIIVYAPIYKTWFEYFLDNFREQPVHFGVESKVQMDEMVRNSIPLLYQWLIEGKSPNQIRNDPKNKELLNQSQTVFNYNQGQDEYFFGRHYSFFSTLNSVNNALAWSKVKSHVLTIYGTSDYVALSEEGAQDIVANVNEGNEGKGTYLEVPEGDHYFAKVASKREGAKLSQDNNYVQYARQNYHPDIAVKTIEWIKTIN